MQRFIAFKKLLEEIQDFEANKTYSYHQPVNVVRLFVDKVESIVRDLQSESIPSESKSILQETARLVHEVFFSTDAYTQERFFIYRHIWSELLHNNEQLQEEEKRIDTKMNPLSKALASSHLLFLNDEDRLAMDLLKKTTCFCCKSVLLLVRGIIKCNEMGSCEKLAFLYV